MIQSPALHKPVAQPQTKSRVKLNRRGLTELVLACAFLSLFTFAIWSWQSNGYVAAAESTAPEVEVSLLPLILRHPAIMASTVVTEFILLLALTLAIVPLSWWVRTDYLMANEGARLMTPLRWLGQRLRFSRPPTQGAEGEVQGVYTTDEAGATIFLPQGVDGEVEQEVVMVEQSDGTLMAMVQQPDGTMVPAESLSKEGKESKEGNGEESTEPLLPAPGPTTDVLSFEEEEEDPLADLADIGDILSSAFDEDSAIDPEREAISRSLEDVDIYVLLKDARNVLATFQQ